MGVTHPRSNTDHDCASDKLFIIEDLFFLLSRVECLTPAFSSKKKLVDLFCSRILISLVRSLNTFCYEVYN